MTAYTSLASPVPEDLVEELLKRIAYVSHAIHTARLEPARDRVAFDLAEQDSDRVPAIAAAISDLALQLTRNHRPAPRKTLAVQERLPSLFHEDPHPLLERRGEMVRFGRGRYGLGPMLVALMTAFDTRVQELASAIGARPHVFPSMIGADVLDRCKYFRNFPASLSFVSHLREDHEGLRGFARSAAWDGEALAFDHAGLAGMECLLAPSVCFHWYAWLSGSRLGEPRVITAAGKCFRYESSNLSGLERLWDFTMREVIFAGSPDAVARGRESCLDLATTMLGELGVAYEISSATDPFFVDAFAVQAAYQQGFDLKFELLLPLPYVGKTIAAGSINYHQDFFGRSFDIEAEGRSAHTACIGFGLERLALAFLAQHGVDEQNWPAAVVSRLRPPPGTSRHG